MIPKHGAKVLCSPWAWSAKNGASFTCDDTAFTLDQLPYRIDPSTHTLTDPGTCQVASWYAWTYYEDGSFWEHGQYAATVAFNTVGLLPAGSQRDRTYCGFSVISQDGPDSPVCRVLESESGLPTDVVEVRYDVDHGSTPYSDHAFVNNITLTIVAYEPPVLLSPANGAVNVPTSTQLQWANEYGNWNVYFGTTNSPPPISLAPDGANHNPTLAPGTTYYWKVTGIAVISMYPFFAYYVDSPMWSFTTATALPPPVTLSAPTTAATNQSLNPALAWGASSGATSYDVYLGTSASPPFAVNVTGTSYTPAAALNPSTLYYWKVIAKNSAGSAPASATWSFTTLPSAPPAVSLTAPTNTASNQLSTVSLSWASASGATSYDVYLGNSTPPAFVVNVAGTTYTPGTTLNLGLTYYWKIVAKNAGGSAPASPTWSFAVVPISPPTFSPPSGTYTAGQTVTLGSITPGVSIRYTTDGSTPTSTAGTPYSVPFAVSATTTVKAIAFKSGSIDSPVSSATYTLTGTVAAPTFSPASGTYSAPQTVTLATTTPGASIRYTTDGSIPTAIAGTIYTAPFTVSGTQVVNALAYKTDWTNSVVSSAAYTVTAPVQTVTTIPASLPLLIDSVPCTSPCSFPWAAGSVHTIVAAPTQPGSTGTQYLFVSWSQGGPGTQTITTPSSAMVYAATYKTQYYLTTSAGSGGSIAPPSGWFDSGPVSVSAAVTSTFYFTGFSVDLTGTVSPQNLTLDGPKSVTASFAVIPTTTITASPAGLHVAIDGSDSATPATFQWIPGTNHTLAASATIAAAPGSQYALVAWSQGGGASQTLIAPSSAATFTATYKTQHYLTSSASSGGTISPLSGWYDSGVSVPITATSGNGYWFAGFSGDLSGLTSSQALVMSAPRTVTAAFGPIVTVASLPAGRSISIDGVPCTVPCTFQWITGSTYTLDAPQIIPLSTLTQYAFASWSQGGYLWQTVTAQAPITYTATYSTQYFLTTTATPGGNITPLAGWYNSGTSVSVSAVALDAFGFIGFTGDLISAVNPASVTMSSPKTLTVNFAAADFTLTATSTATELIPGDPQGGAVYTVTVTPINGFTGAVVFAVSGLPPGATAGFSPATITGSGSTTLTIANASAIATAGNYKLAITGTSGAMARSATATANVQDFSLSMTPPAQTVNCQGSITYQITATALSGFSRPISLSVMNSSLDFASDPPSTTLYMSNGVATSTLTLRLPGSPTCTTRHIQVQVRARTGQAADRYATADLAVKNAGLGAEFTLSANPSSATITAPGSANYGVTVIPVNGFSGTVSFSVSTPPAGIRPTSAPAP
jgi:hypothetical protein